MKSPGPLLQAAVFGPPGGIFALNEQSLARVKVAAFDTSSVACAMNVLLLRKPI